MSNETRIGMGKVDLKVDKEKIGPWFKIQKDAGRVDSAVTSRRRLRVKNTDGSFSEYTWTNRGRMIPPLK